MSSISAALRHLLNANPDRAGHALEAVIAALPDDDHNSKISASEVTCLIADALESAE